jgi:AcrR family transcriptional regulator
VHSQRERILDAVTNLTAAHGYIDLKVEDIAEQAAVSLNAFYEHFADKEDAFLVAYEIGHAKMLLANLPEGEQRNRLGSMRLTKRTPNTITGKAALQEELRMVRGAGLAVSHEELARGLIAAAAPVRNEASVVVAAVSLSAARSTVSLDDLVNALRPLLVSSACQISGQLGYRPSDGRARALR